MKPIKLLFGMTVVIAVAFFLVPALMPDSSSAHERQLYITSELEFEEIPVPEDQMESRTFDEKGEPIPGAELPSPQGELPLLFEHEEPFGGRDSTVDQVERQLFIAI